MPQGRAAWRAVLRAAPWAPLAALAAGACASPGIPPGGPVDKDPPVLVSISPDTNAVGVTPGVILLRFDEVINERSTPIGGTTSAAGTGAGGGGQFGAGAGGGFGGGFSGGQFSTMGSQGMGSSLGTLVILSPGDGRERVRWRRDGIEIEPRTRFRANTTYRLTLLAGLSDLRGNILREPIEVVFSTGPTRTTGTVEGAVFDWVGGKAIPRARVELFAASDTALRWNARADSLGRFRLHDLPPGRWLLRGYADVDGDRVLDAREIFDTLTVTLDTTATHDLYAFAHDTIGPRIESLEPVDSTALRLRFDRGVATGWVPDSTTVTLMRADSSVVALLPLIPAAAFDSVRKAAASAADRGDAADSLPADSAAGRQAAAPRDTAIRDTTARDTTARDTPRAAADTAKAPRGPQPTRPLPILQWVVRPAEPLPPGEYRLKIRGVPGLTGAVRPSEREFRLRPPAPPRDSTAGSDRSAGRAPAGAAAGTPTRAPAATRPPTRPPTREEHP